MLENQIRGLAVVFGVFINQMLRASGINALSAAMKGLFNDRPPSHRAAK